MIKVRTECNECIHCKMCKYIGRADTLSRKLKNTNCRKGPNGDYSWDKVSSIENIDIEFVCPDFIENVIAIRNREREKNI